MQPSSDDPQDWRPGSAELAFTSFVLAGALFYCGVSWLGFGHLIWESWRLGCGVDWPLLLLVAGPAAIVLCGVLAVAAALRAPDRAGPGTRRLYTITSTIFWMTLPVALLLSCGALSAFGRPSGPC